MVRTRLRYGQATAKRFEGSGAGYAKPRYDFNRLVKTGIRTWNVGYVKTGSSGIVMTEVAASDIWRCQHGVQPADDSAYRPHERHRPAKSTPPFLTSRM